MKKRILVSVILAVSFAVIGCGNETDARKNNSTVSVNDIMNKGVEDAAASGTNDSTVPGISNKSEDGTDNSADASAGTSADSKEVVVNTSDVDVDLTALSSTMVYSEVYNMMTAPDGYLGKTVKMEGQLAMYHDDATGKNYFACIISDATACCSQGIEFELTDEYTYPDDYPEVGEEICVTGTFDTYVEGEYQYCTLRNAKKCVM